MAKPSTVIELALAQVGTRENPPGSNKQPYGAELDTMPWYLYKDSSGKVWIHHVNSFDWCTSFHDDMFIRAYGIDKARKMLFRPEYNNYGAVVKYSWNYYKAKNRTGSEPKKGCSIFFQNAKGLSHIGIVYDFDGKYVYTVEGNSGTNNQYVVKNKYLRTDNYIYGYGYPDFDEEDPKYVPGKWYTKTCKDYLNLRTTPAVKDGNTAGTLTGHPRIRADAVTWDVNGNTWLEIGGLWVCATYGKETYIS